MKQLISILLLTGVLMQTFSKLVLFTQYEVNKEYITRTYCENKSRPKMHCNGKCHLMKQMNQEDKSNTLPTNAFKEKTEVQWFTEKKQVPEVICFSTSAATLFFYPGYLPQNNRPGVFHPPSV